MSILDRFLKGGSKGPQAPRFVRTDESSGATYEVFSANDAESAKEFLLTKRVGRDKYYVMVETPEGTWGLDKLGLYLERLLPFQTQLSSAHCDGRTCAMPDPAGLEMAANGINESFVIKVGCGKCQHEWLDAVRYQNVTVVRCPKCTALSRIDTRNVHRIVTAGYPLFDKFMHGIDSPEREKAIAAMSCVSLPHEILAVYPSTTSFAGATELVSRLADHFHPICRRFSEGGAVYVRCYFASSASFGDVVGKLRANSEYIDTRPEEAEVALHGIDRA